MIADFHSRNSICVYSFKEEHKEELIFRNISAPEREEEFINV